MTLHLQYTKHVSVHDMGLKLHVLVSFECITILTILATCRAHIGVIFVEMYELYVCVCVYVCEYFVLYLCVRACV